MARHKAPPVLGSCEGEEGHPALRGRFLPLPHHPLHLSALGLWHAPLRAGGPPPAPPLRGCSPKNPTHLATEAGAREAEGKGKERNQLPWVCLSQLRIRSCPSTLYEVYEHTPQLAQKARGPKDYQSSAVSRPAGSDPTVFLSPIIYTMVPVFSKLIKGRILSEGLRAQGPNERNAH